VRLAGFDFSWTFSAAVWLRIGVVAYKGPGESHLTRDFALRRMEGAQVGQILDFVRGLEASGGGDDPEPVELALKVAIDMPWRADVQGRMIVIGDALARDRQAALDLATQFRNTTQQAELPRVVSTIYAGDESVSPGSSNIATAGGGEYSVNQGQIIVGWHPGLCEQMLNDGSVSRHHRRLGPVAGAFLSSRCWMSCQFVVLC
jgi:hypothetical protein